MNTLRLYCDGVMLLKNEDFIFHIHFTLAVQITACLVAVHAVNVLCVSCLERPALELHGGRGEASVGGPLVNRQRDRAFNTEYMYVTVRVKLRKK